MCLGMSAIARGGGSERSLAEATRLEGEISSDLAGGSEVPDIPPPGPTTGGSSPRGHGRSFPACSCGCCFCWGRRPGAELADLGARNPRRGGVFLADAGVTSLRTFVEGPESADTPVGRGWGCLFPGPRPEAMVGAAPRAFDTHRLTEDDPSLGALNLGTRGVGAEAPAGRASTLLPFRARPSGGSFDESCSFPCIPTLDGVLSDVATRLQGGFPEVVALSEEGCFVTSCTVKRPTLSSWSSSSLPASPVPFDLEDAKT